MRSTFTPGRSLRPTLPATSTGRPALLALALLLLAPARARAAVSEPDPTIGSVPKPVTASEMSLAGGANPPSEVRLSLLFSNRGETIDYVRDAQTTPATFSPLCGFTGQLVLRGGGCEVDFGWYNVDPNRTGPPPDSEIYVLVPNACGNAMCPDPPPRQPFHPGVGQPLGMPFDAGQIRADTRYKQGLIGFAMLGNDHRPDHSCSQTHYSEQDLNQVCRLAACGGKHWITAVVYQSTVTPNAYYIAFEDLPTTEMSFAGTGMYTNDGDFNDFVYFITGITCDGGGTPCDTKMMGDCAEGVNECTRGTNGTMLTCRQVVQPKDEVCDGLDNNCDGMVDNGATCDKADEICDRGRCVHPCDNESEFFKCTAGLTCAADGYCKDPDCVDKVCAEGQICVRGQCLGGCTGVKCPQGQVCRIGTCIDPCEGVTCPDQGGEKRHCEGGACVGDCNCRQCGAGKVCAQTGSVLPGNCVEKGCEKKSCGTGMVCAAGNCVGVCDGVTCPAGQDCNAGKCVDVPRPDGGITGTGGSEPAVIDARPGSGGRRGTGGSGTSADAGMGGNGGSSGSGGKGQGVSSCSCDAGAPSGPAAVALPAALVLAAAWTRRRRRRRR